MLLLLLSIGWALRLPSLFRLTHSHQRLFAHSRGFLLRERHSNGCGEINPTAHLSPSVCLLGDRHDIRPIGIGEGQEHNHSVHCAIQRGETGIHVLCAPLALQQHLLPRHRCGRFARPSLFRLDGRCVIRDSDPSLRCPRVWSVSEQSGGSRMHAHALHRLEAHLVHDEVPTKECEGDGGVFACSSLQVALHAHRLDSSLSSLNENSLHSIYLCEGEL